MNSAYWLTPLLMAIAAFVAWAARRFIKAEIDSSVKHHYDRELELLRAQLRQSDEALKSDLRSKETAISALREAVLSGRGQRQALLEQRRLQAIERLWSVTMALAPYRARAHTLTSLKNIDEIAERQKREPNIRRFVEALLLPGEFKGPMPSAREERPFVSPTAWAYFSAYQAILAMSHAILLALQQELDRITDLVNVEYSRALLREALPEMAEYIGELKVEQMPNLLPMLEERLHAEIVDMLSGKQADAESLTRASDIMKAAHKMQVDLL